VDKQIISQYIKDEAINLGFSHCGISQATFLEEEAAHLSSWLAKQYNGEMKYMENHFDMRLDPRLLVPNAKSVISLTYNYFTDAKQNETAPKISKYAYGEDYHFVVKDKLKELLNRLTNLIGAINGRCFVDSAPILERAWAKRAGIGWLGKHSLLINKKHGSFFFLAEIIVDVELLYDEPFQADHCGTCRACVDACPTEAILENNTIDGSKCISYFTIELKDQLPTTYKNKLDDEKLFTNPIVTEITKFETFYPAEDYHQNYYKENGAQPYCMYIIRPKLEKFKKVFGDKMK